MADFKASVEQVLVHEGGFVNDPDDTPTNYGITQDVYSKWIGRPASVSDVQAMPRDEAVKIYEKMYWRLIKGDSIMSQDVADVFLDMAVLRGVSAASRSMQTILGQTVDGVVGPQTLRSLNATPTNIAMLYFVRQCVLAFVSIAMAQPRKLKFLRNWVTRVMSYEDVISSSRAATAPAKPVA